MSNLYKNIHNNLDARMKTDLIKFISDNFGKIDKKYVDNEVKNDLRENMLLYMRIIDHNYKKMMFERKLLSISKKMNTHFSPIEKTKRMATFARKYYYSIK